MLYITLGDQPSGIYQGQVIDVCNFLNKELNANLRLVAFISIRGFRKNSKKIKASNEKAIVLPMFPKLKNWYLNRLSLAFICMITGERIAVCRNVFATKIALSLKSKGLIKKVCFDGRGAVAAEWEEYDVVSEKSLLTEIGNLERSTVIQSDFRIAVSEKLVNYWKNNYNYNSGKHVVIPCTLSTNFNTKLPSAPDIRKYRKELGYREEDIVLVYAGSTAGWQSFSLLGNFLSPLLRANPAIKVLFLSKEDQNNKALKGEYRNQVIIKWVEPEEVRKHLSAADYGLLLREPSITNKVAAPTKFAEYLIAGLPIVISENLGDYTSFVLTQKCGVVIGKRTVSLQKTSFSERLRLNSLAIEYFLKKSPVNLKNYKQLINYLN